MSSRRFPRGTDSGSGRHWLQETGIFRRSCRRLRFSRSSLAPHHKACRPSRARSCIPRGGCRSRARSPGTRGTRRSAPRANQLCSGILPDVGSSRAHCGTRARRQASDTAAQYTQAGTCTPAVYHSTRADSPAAAGTRGTWARTSPAGSGTRPETRRNRACGGSLSGRLVQNRTVRPSPPGRCTRS